MKNLISIIISFLLYSCVAQKKVQDKVSGTYETKEKEVFERIILNSDFTFIYNYSGGLIKSKSQGNWRIVNNTLKLKSYTEYLTNQIKVKEFIGKGEIIIRDIQNNEIQNAIIILNSGQEVLETNNKGIVSLKKDQDIKVFEVHYLGEIYKYKIKDVKTNSYKITLYLSNLNKTYFDNENFRIKNKSLINYKGLKFIKKS